MMLSFTWVLFLLLAAGLSMRNKRPKLDLPIASPEFVESYKLFLSSSLSPEGFARRNLLIASGIIPHPPEFRSQRHFYESVSSDDDISLEVQEYIESHVLGILNNKERLDEFLRALFGERLPLEESIKDSTLQNEKFAEFSRLSDESMTEATVEDDIEIATLNYMTSEELENSSASDKDDDRLTSDTTDEKELPPRFVDFIADFEKLLAESLLFNRHESDSTTSTVSEYPIETGDQSSEIATSWAKNNFIPAEYNFFRPSTMESAGFSHIHNPSKMPLEITPDYLTSETSANETILKEINADLDEELSTSEYVQSLLNQNIRTADVQLIDKVIPISAEEYKYSIENYPELVDSVDMYKTSSDKMEIEFPNEFEKTQSFDSTEIEKQVKKDSISIKELQRQIFKYRGIPGKHFPNYEDFPNTTFVCHSQKHIPGFYADQETNCQVFHVCWPFRKESFLCPIGTIFNQAILACDHWYKSNCSLSQAYYDVNIAFDENNSSMTGTVGPMVDTLLKASEKDRPIKTQIISSSKDVSKLYIADVHFSEATANEELTHIWKFLPVKVKIFIYPEPKFMDYVRSAILESKRAQRESEIMDANLKNRNKLDFETESKGTINEGIKSVNLGILRELSLQNQQKVDSV